MKENLPIGIFDSGVGGLTVLRALQARLPEEDFIYLGDTARLPYGTKSRETIIRYALQATEQLNGRGIKALVIACNTATAHALPALELAYPDIPVIGVIGPGAEAAAAHQNILVLATEGTVRAGAYQEAIWKLRPDATITALPATLLVTLAEEGWTTGPEAEAIIRRYLQGITLPECVVLGCTHFPLLCEALAQVVGPDVALVDSAQTTATATAGRLAALKLLKKGGVGKLKLLATDGQTRFARMAALFLGQKVDESDIELVDL